MSDLKCAVCQNTYPSKYHFSDIPNVCTNCKNDPATREQFPDIFEKHDEKMRLLETIPITTTNHIDGHQVVKYIDIECVEIVIGTGVISEIVSDFQDFFGARSKGFEKKLQDAKKFGFDVLKRIAVDKGGNAVIGIDIDYSSFQGNRMAIIINGTVVQIEPKITGN